MSNPEPTPAIRARVTALLCAAACLPLLAGFAGAVPTNRHATGHDAAAQPVTMADMAALKLAMERQ